MFAFASELRLAYLVSHRGSTHLEHIGILLFPYYFKVNFFNLKLVVLAFTVFSHTGRRS